MHVGGEEYRSLSFTNVSDPGLHIFLSYSSGIFMDWWGGKLGTKLNHNLCLDWDAVVIQRFGEICPLSAEYAMLSNGLKIGNFGHGVTVID